ncbi:MAG: alpha-ketoglutarate-dependent dioxygenase AlkB family protein [Ilumatobacteraceae bacterium]
MSTPSLFSDQRELLPFDGSALLIPKFLLPGQTEPLFQQIMNETVWEKPEMVMFGKKYSQAGLSTWYTDTEIPYVYSGITRQPHQMTVALANILRLCEDAISASFNSVLVNLYRDGNDSVSWHADNEEINGSEPVIASVSLGATRRFDLRHKETGETVRVDLEDGSLLVMSGLSQHCWVHQIAKTKAKVGPRINLTFRRVVSNAKP